MISPEPLPPGPFACIVADPPWEFRDRGVEGAAANHYATMATWEIAMMPVEEIAAPDAHLYLWTTDSHIFEAGAVMKAWGFRYIQILPWIKVNEDGKLQMGTGHYWRHCSEVVLFGVRGRLKPLVRDELAVFWAPRGKHSEKPGEFYEKVERFTPGPRVDIFARKSREGWTTWGDQAPAAEPPARTADDAKRAAALEHLAKYSIEMAPEEDGRWIGEVPALPGVLVYGATRAEALAAVEELAVNVLIEMGQHGEAMTLPAHACVVGAWYTPPSDGRLMQRSTNPSRDGTLAIEFKINIGAGREYWADADEPRLSADPTQATECPACSYMIAAEVITPETTCCPHCKAGAA